MAIPLKAQVSWHTGAYDDSNIRPSSPALLVIFSACTWFQSHRKISLRDMKGCLRRRILQQHLGISELPLCMYCPHCECPG
jgi:hypothetical protein